MSIQVEHASTEIHAEEVRAVVDHILSSHAFRNSKRHTRFLRFVVEKTLAGELHQIKERTIGIEVFDRDPDYDLSCDPIVRVGAGDIRKRLAQYYAEEGSEVPLRISLPSGAYIPLFSAASLPRAASAALAQPEPVHVPDPVERIHTETTQPDADMAADASKSAAFGGSRESRRTPAWIVFVMTICAFAVGVLAYWKVVPHGSASSSDRFWQAAMANDADAVLCVGDLNFLMVKDSDGSPSTNAQLEGVMATKNHVGPADVAALARVAATFGHYGRRFRVLLADDATLSDLRSSPAVLIGAMDNEWTSRLLSSSRFRLSEDPSTRVGRISDTAYPDRSDWTIDMRLPISAIRRDYGLVTRTSNALTGQTDYVIAGIGPYGTAAASEFVTNPMYLEQFTSRAPADWYKHDLQIVVSTDVVNGRTAPPHMVSYDVR